MSTTGISPAELQVKQLSDEFFKPPAPNIVNRCSGIRSIYDSMQISVGGWIKILIASVILGLGIYGLVVAFSYWHTAKAMQNSQASFTQSWRPDVTLETAAAVTLDDLGIAINKDLKDELVSAMDVVRKTMTGKTAELNHMPPLALATQLVRASMTGSCSTCGGDCEGALEPIITRLLLGWPTTPSGRVADTTFLYAQASVPGNTPTTKVEDQKAKNAACRAVAKLQSLTPSIFSPRLLWGRQEPWPAPLVAQLVLGADKCMQPGTSAGTATQLSHDRCVLVTRLFQSVIDNAEVKSDRAFLVDFFYGWERAAVAVLAFVVALALRRLRKARQRFELEAKWIQEKLENPSLKRGLDPTYATESISAPVAATALRNSFLGAFTPQLDGTAREPVAEIVIAAAEAVTQEDLGYMQTFVDRNLAEMESSRELINSIITIFPVIGFSATLLSLVNALAGANQIATSSGDLRSAAILNTTSLLSSCFATTFLALVCMAIFVVLNLLAASADRRLLTTLSERLISTFRPGRKYEQR